VSNTLGMSLASSLQREAPTNGLVREAGNGDSAALIRLYEAASPEILGFIMSLISSREVAEEVLLDSFTDAWRQSPTVDPGRIDVSEWMRVLARARAVKKLHSSEAETNPSGADAEVAAVVPAEFLKDLLLMRIEREPQNPTQEQFTIAAAPHHRQAFGTARDPEAVRAWLPWVLAGVLAVAAILLFYNWHTSDQARKQTNSDFESTSKTLATTADQLKSASDRAGELKKVEAILTKPGTRIVLLENPADAPDAAIVVLWNSLDGKCVVTGTLPVPQPGKAYQLWLASPGSKPSSIAHLQPDGSGHVFMIVEVGSSSARQATLQITQEPQGGSPQPSTDTYASGKIG
jgi:DNA-directed RNA polymerase specialized sigma24 family protein